MAPLRLAFFSPLPPVKSGIADYSAALLDPLAKITSLQTFTERPAAFDSAPFDIALYQIGNNPHHDFAYEMALDHPGAIVLHEANLHHLIADITIKRGNWDAYLEEVEYNGGAAALEGARRVRALEIGPDYEGLPMLRRVLARSRAVIVHSASVECEVRAAGFRGPVGRIPHGAWIPTADRMSYRERLGLDESAPLIGIFGFLKPYKRIAESLRAFRRLLRNAPAAKMILCGEAHPELPLVSLIHSMGLESSVRVLGFTPIEDFTGYLGACDIVLNLRYPTVGESSGTLLRSLGLGKAVVVSDIGSFREFPDDICLKAPVDSSEEDHLYEYLNLLVARPTLARAMGERARAWVARECNWPLVAERYASFLRSVSEGVPWAEANLPPREPEPDETSERPAIEEEVRNWSSATEDSQLYAETHLTRLARTLEITPPGGPSERILEMGAYLQITPALKNRLGYGEVRGCYYGPAGRIDHRRATSREGERFECDVDHFDAENERFPYDDEYFSTVLCCELLEHLAGDPMAMMSEINRILKPGGHLVLTTPNIVSLRAIGAILLGYHPGFFPAYLKPTENGEIKDARHSREYAVHEIHFLLNDSGFEVERIETGPFREEPKPEQAWVKHLLDRYILPSEQRGDGIYAVGRKTGPIRKRYPDWLYS